MSTEPRYAPARAGLGIVDIKDIADDAYATLRGHEQQAAALGYPQSL